MRPVNIIQHDDAGPSLPPAGPGEEEAETIELPPAYTALRGPDPPPPAAGTSAAYTLLPFAPPTYYR
ncbi:hypothetical protein NMY22_g13012 [Coprinellus aureogranulatus]|nr:hypothetical protein NMY22_g13012 [Coprinellus aureogranulatus]